MTVQTTTHLNFRGEARAALEHYQHVFGGDLVALTYAESATVREGADPDHVMWGQVEAPNGFRVMAFDVPAPRAFDRGQESFFVAVRGTDVEEVTDLWSRLVEGATVVEDLGPAEWSPVYGMLTDRFGVTWVLDAVAPYPGA